jgi:hypothetical protein
MLLNNGHKPNNCKPSIANFDGDERTLQFWDDCIEFASILLTKRELKMTEQQIKKITDEVTAILLKKNADYGSASFDLGLNGNMVHLWDKVRRYRSLVENKSNPNFESVEDTLKDIIGYAIIGLIILEQENSLK